jgi:hypothetical protein
VLFESGTVKDIKGNLRPPNNWVEVTGVVEFREVPGGGGATTMLVVPSPDAVKGHPAPSDPYIR